MYERKGSEDLPPGFIIVPSRSRPGQFSYWSQALGQKFATVDLAWIAYERIISANRDRDTVVKETIEPLSPLKEAPRLSLGSSDAVTLLRRKSNTPDPDERTPKLVEQSSPPSGLQTGPESTQQSTRDPAQPGVSESKNQSTRATVGHLTTGAGTQARPRPILNSTPPLFIDPDFPPDARSIGNTNDEDPLSRLRISRHERTTARWIRLPDYIREVNGLDDSVEIELFGDIEPHDLTQGVVGDCWLLATMACLAEFPHAVESLFCGTEKATPDGKYTIRLFDLDKRQWEAITIDDHIPCTYENDFSKVPFTLRADGVKVYDGSVPPKRKLKPLFAVPNGNQMWAALLEKAMAKFVGSYALIAGGHEPYAMIAFTGFPQVYQYKRVPLDAERSIAKVGEWERGWAQWAGKASPSCGYRPALENQIFLNAGFFAKLLEYDRLNYLMAASIVCYKPPKTPEDFIRPDGLVLGHAYSLLAVEDFGTVRLVKLRNPHGRGSPEHPTEWNGRWSDASKEWDQHAEISESIGHERVLHDGIFWMELNDFVAIFDKVLVLPYPMSEPRGALSSIRRAKLRASIRTATQTSKEVAGMALQELTHVDQVVTAIHLMSIRPYDPYLNAPEWVKQDRTRMNQWAYEKLGINKNHST